MGSTQSVRVRWLPPATAVSLHETCWSRMDRYKPKCGIARLMMQRTVRSTLALDWWLTVAVLVP